MSQLFRVWARKGWNRFALGFWYKKSPCALPSVIPGTGWNGNDPWGKSSSFPFGMQMGRAKTELNFLQTPTPLKQLRVGSSPFPGLGYSLFFICYLKNYFFVFLATSFMFSPFLSSSLKWLFQLKIPLTWTWWIKLGQDDSLDSISSFQAGRTTLTHSHQPIRLSPRNREAHFRSCLILNVLKIGF